MSRTVQGADIAVGAKIRAMRVASGLSQSELAKRVGITYQQMHKYERGLNRISVGRLTEIADALGMHPASLLDYGEGEQRHATARRGVLELSRLASSLDPHEVGLLTALASRLGARHAG